MKRTRRLAHLFLLWQAGRGFGGDRGGTSSCTLDQLKNSRRVLLFSSMPRMLRGDGLLAAGLPPGFSHVDRGADGPRAVTVSTRRWRRALALSRSIHRGGAN